MKILANDGISQVANELLAQQGFDVLDVKVAQNQLSKYINQEEIDILLVRSATKVTKEIIDHCPSLKLIGRAGVGLDNIEVDYAQNKGIRVINTPDASSYSVAELVFAHLFAGVRFLYDANRNMPLEGDTHFKELKESYLDAQELKGKTLGIIGLGRIGKAVAQIAIGLGMRVLAHDIQVKETTITLSFFDGQNLDFKIQTIDKETLLKESDFITIHVPNQQKPIISEQDFVLMKQGVGIINTSRASAVEEAVLIQELDNEKIAFVGLDVYENEPTPSVQILMHPRISHTPHVGATTTEAQNRIGQELAMQIIDIFKKK